MKNIDESALFVSGGKLRMATTKKTHSYDTLSDDERRSSTKSYYDWDYWDNTEEVQLDELPEDIRQKWSDKVSMSRQENDEAQSYQERVRSLIQMVEAIEFPEVDGVVYIHATAATDSRIDFVAQRRGVASLDDSLVLIPSDCQNLDSWMKEQAGLFLHGVMQRLESNAKGGWFEI